MKALAGVRPNKIEGEQWYYENFEKGRRKEKKVVVLLFYAVVVIAAAMTWFASNIF